MFEHVPGAVESAPFVQLSHVSVGFPAASNNVSRMTMDPLPAVLVFVTDAEIDDIEVTTPRLNATHAAAASRTFRRRWLIVRPPHDLCSRAVGID